MQSVKENLLAICQHVPKMILKVYLLENITVTAKPNRILVLRRKAAFSRRPCSVLAAAKRAKRNASVKLTRNINEHLNVLQIWTNQRNAKKF